MSSEASTVATNVRLHEWAMQVQDCRNRPTGIDVQTWCKQNGITKANYYYRLRKVREAFLTQVDQASTTASFVELKQPNSIEIPQSCNTSKAFDAAARMTLQNQVTLEISNCASKEFLTDLIGAIKSC